MVLKKKTLGGKKGIKESCIHEDNDNENVKFMRI